MDIDSLKHSLKTGSIFLLTMFILFFAIISGTQTKYLKIDSFNIISILLVILLFFSVIFYFLFKYQREECHQKSMFWKLPLMAATFGILAMFILTGYLIFTCSGEACMGIFIIILYSPIVAIILTIIALILVFNSWYETNLYTVAWTMFAFVLLPSMILIALRQGLEEPAFLMPFGFLVGTLLAVYLKKSSTEIKGVINKGALFGGIIITLLTFIVLFILGEFKNFEFNLTFLMVSSIIIILSGIIGAIIGFIYGKLKSKKEFNQTPPT